jgi:hypothetical protein
MRELKTSGKGVYIWNATRLGSPAEVVKVLKKGNIDFVAIKIHDGTGIYQDLEPYFEIIQDAGIETGSWGYVYLGAWAGLEAAKTIEAIDRYRPSFYLIDAEAHAKNQFAGATIFAKILRAKTDIPLGLNSYWKPSYHQEIPWRQLREISDFDAPQVYWRGQRPVMKLLESMKEYDLMEPRLPYALPAGDMFDEHGIKPTPEQLIQFCNACVLNREIQGVIMWSLDQVFEGKVPELWTTYSSYDWKKGEILPIEEVPISAEMKTYVKKPVTVQAAQWFPGVIIPGVNKSIDNKSARVETQHGEVLVLPGDWIVWGIENELYPCKNNVFQATYEPLNQGYSVVITASRGLNVRSEPSTMGKVMGVLMRGDRVNVLEEKGDWLRAKEGWIHGNYTRKV